MDRRNTKFGLMTASAFVVANMVGTGVFTSLGFQLAATDNFVAIMGLWLLGGIIALCGALVYGELSSVLPRSGGEYHFIGSLYSPMLGFLAGWISLVVGFAAPVALSCMAFSSYAGTFLPWLSPKMLAITVLSVITLLHTFSLRLSGNLQGILTIVKIVVIILFILLGLVLPGNRQPIVSESLRTFSPGDILSTGFAVSIIWVYYAYSGWNASAYIVDDIRDPQHNLPRSLLYSTLFVTVLYMLLNAVFLISTPAEELTGQVEVGLICAKHIFGTGPGNLMGAIIALLLLSSISSMAFIGPRVSYRMGEEHRLLRFLTRKRGADIPISALIFQYVLSLVMILTGSFKFLTEYTGILLSLSSLMTVAGLFIHRKRHPGMKRPFRTPLYPLTPILFCIPILFSLFYLFRSNFLNLAISGGTLLVGIILYLIDKNIRHEK